jgi:hypothetical protein
MTNLTAFIEKPHPSVADTVLREQLRRVLKNRDRRQIAAALTSALGVAVSVHMINLWCADRRGCYRFPACYVDALCRAVGNDELRLALLSDELRAALEIGQRALYLLKADSQRARRRASGPASFPARPVPLTKETAAQDARARGARP